MTANLLSRRTSRACSALFALLCLLTTALFAVADASTPVPGSAPSRTTAVSAPDRSAPTRVVGASVADADNPFEHGRLPSAGAAVASAHPVSTKPGASDEAGPVSADAVLPERPPRG